jgi:hypothetical protein
MLLWTAIAWAGNFGPEWTDRSCFDRDEAAAQATRDAAADGLGVDQVVPSGASMCCDAGWVRVQGPNGWRGYRYNGDCSLIDVDDWPSAPAPAIIDRYGRPPVAASEGCTAERAERVARAAFPEPGDDRRYSWFAEQQWRVVVRSGDRWEVRAVTPQILDGEWTWMAFAAVVVDARCDVARVSTRPFATHAGGRAAYAVER